MKPPNQPSLNTTAMLQPLLTSNANSQCALKIYGIGTDIVSIERINAVLEKFPDQFCQKILSAHELTEFHQAENKSAFVAKRWAIKEAFVKALGTGFRQGIKMDECETLHDELGKPYIHCLGITAETTASLSIKNCFVSISDEKAYAIAFVILTQN